MNEDIVEIIDTLDMLLEDLPAKPKVFLEKILKNFKNLEDEFEAQNLMKIQDELEVLSNMTNLDSFSRNQIINVLSVIETLI